MPIWITKMLLERARPKPWKPIDSPFLSSQFCCRRAPLRDISQLHRFLPAGTFLETHFSPIPCKWKHLVNALSQCSIVIISNREERNQEMFVLRKKQKRKEGKLCEKIKGCLLFSYFPCHKALILAIMVPASGKELEKNLLVLIKDPYCQNWILCPGFTSTYAHTYISVLYAGPWLPCTCGFFN